MMTPTRLLSRLLLLALICLASVLITSEHGHAQEFTDASGAGDVIPGSYQNSGSFFNRKLGTVMRFSYHTNGYGHQDDIVTLGGMKVFNLEGAAFFLDGQATLSEDFGGGFNAGIGYRQLMDTGLSFDSQRIQGISFWTDGQSTSADNFFTQLGFNAESLGESFDARIGGYFPLDRTKVGDPALTALNAPMFLGNNLVSEGFLRFTDTAHSVVDGEIAKRIGNREAWAFLGGYQIGGGSVDATGYRIGVRGYAMPDLALSLQITDDDVYHTNVVFGLTWFVGRTHRGNQPTGTLLDRFREPVQRNDFIATTQASEMVAGGDPLQDAANPGADLRFVHIDSSAAAGGDGTFESPLTSFAGASAASLDNDTVLVHADSAFGGQYALKDGQRVIGEGGGIVHTANTLELGVINLPETALGALAGTVPVITGVGDVFTMANNNEINNFTINGGTRAVFADGVNAPVLRNLAINNPTVDGIVMANITGAGSIDDTVTITDAAGIGLLVDGGSAAATYSPTIVNSMGQSIVVRNRTDGILTLGSLVTDTGAGILVENNTGGTTNFTGALSLMTTTNDAVRLMTNTGATVNFSGGLDIDTTSGIGFFADGGGTIAATGTNTIDTTTGVGLDVRNMTIDAANFMFDSVNVTNGGATGINLDTLDGTGQVIVGSGLNPADGGTLTVTGTAIRINEADNATFNNVTIANTAIGSNGVILTSSFGDETFFSGLNITTEATGFSSIGGGELSVTGTNTIRSQTGTALQLDSNVIDVAGVTFDSVTTVAGTGTGIELKDLLGGTVTVGPGNDTDGAGGTFTTVGTAISVDNVTGAVFNDITVTNTAAPGVNVTGQTAGNVLFNNLIIETTTAAGVTVENNTGGTIGFDDLNVMTTTGDAVVLDNNTGATVNINDMVVNSTVSGRGLVAANGGSLGATGTNTIATVTGVGLDLSGVTILGTGATFESVNVTAGVANGIALMDLTGGTVAVGANTGTSGDGGTIVSNGGMGISIDNVADAIISDVIVNNGAGATQSIDITNQAAGSALTFNNAVVTNSTTDAVRIMGNTAGTVTFDTLSANATGAGNGILVDEADASTVAVNFNDITSTVTGAGTGNGFKATGGGVTTISGTNTINASNATAFVVDNVQSLNAVNVTIANGDNRGVEVLNTDNAAGTVAFVGLNVTTSTADAVTVANNTMGTITFSMLNTTSTDGDGITLSGNGGATVAVSSFNVNVTGTGDGFTATGGGTVLASGANTVSTVSGQGINMSGMTIGVAGVNFSSVNVTDGATTGINLATLDGPGQVVVGVTTGAAGSGGTLKTAGTAINVNNVDNLAINRVTIDNTAGAAIGPGVNVTGQDGGTAIFTGLDVSTTVADGVTVDSNTGGTITFDELAVATTDGNAVVVGSNAGATVNFSDMTLNSTGTGNGFTATVSGTLNVTGTNTVATNTGQALDISDQTIGANGVTFDTVNTTNAANAIELDTLTGGFVRIGSGVNPGDGGTLIATNTAIRVTDVDDVTFSNVTINNVAANSDGVIVTNSAGDMAFFSGMDITTDRNGFSVTGGELAVTGTNTITTISAVAGTALDLNNLTVNVAGVTFDSVTAAGTAGIVLDDLTGGTVTIGPNTGVVAAGGILNTSGTSISVTNVENAVFNDVMATSTGGSAAIIAHNSATDSNVVFDNFDGTSNASATVGVFAAGAGEFDVTLRDSDIESTGGKTVLFDTNLGSNRVDFTLTDNAITADDDFAVDAQLDGGTGDVRFLFQGNAMTNDSAASATMNVEVASALTLNATIGRPNNNAPVGDSNTFTNNNAGGTAFEMDLNDAVGTINLDLRDNTAAGGAVDFMLTETVGAFGIVDLANTVTAATNNVGTVNLGGNVEADFDDLAPPVDQVTP